jgi:hypothetical protein
MNGPDDCLGAAGASRCLKGENRQAQLRRVDPLAAVAIPNRADPNAAASKKLARHMVRRVPAPLLAGQSRVVDAAGGEA